VPDETDDLGARCGDRLHLAVEDHAAASPVDHPSARTDDDLTFNRFGVGIRGREPCVVVLRLRAEMSRREAVNLAAWLVALTDEDDEFKRILQAARNS
jgi:hypothetical protein